MTMLLWNHVLRFIDQGSSIEDRQAFDDNN